MEKGDNNSSGFCVSDKKSSFGSNVCSMKLQGTEQSFPSKICMMGFHKTNHFHHFSDFVGDDCGGGGRSTGGGVLGPSGGGGANEVVANIYFDNISTSRGCAEKITNTSLQPFELFPYCSTTPNKKSTGDMAASVGFLFTFAQWKELERQAMIFKYMIASVPVPADLLFPLSRNFPDYSVTLAGGDGMYSKKGDVEPGRCKRTDGKKWRCSRDVAPQQKYCERHLHRGRPRSRKPVEVKNNAQTQKKARLEEPSPLPTTVAAAAAYNQPPHLLHNPRSDLSFSMHSSKGNNRRDMGLMATLDGTQQQLQHLIMGLTNESSSSIYNFHQDYQLLNLLPYSNSRFIDAWSTTDNLNVDHINLPLSFNLPVNQERKKAQAESDVRDSDGQKSKDDSGNSSPVSWEPFASGGPLAEALQLGSVAIGESNPASPSTTPATTTTISSPSGVIHKTLFSNSDSSVCNSPTIAAPPSEVAFQWLN